MYKRQIVNSICGVAKGDEALRWISENIRGVVGYNDISGHINVDRFVIFIADDKINKVIRKGLYTEVTILFFLYIDICLLYTSRCV